MDMSQGLFYESQNQYAVVGTPSTPVTLTTSYATAGQSRIFSVGGQPQMTVYVDYTAAGVGNSIQIKIEAAPLDAITGTTATVYRETSANASGGTVTLTSAERTFVGTNGTTERFCFRSPLADKQVKISVKETVVAGSAGTAAVQALVSGS